MGPIVIVTHGRNIALAHAHFSGIATWEAQMPLPAGMATLSVNKDRSIAMEILPPTESVIADV